MIQWEYKRIQDFADVITGGTPSTTIPEYWENGTIPWLQSGTCQNSVIENCDTFITDKGLQNSSTRLMAKNSILVALTGATTGKVGFLTFEACANQSVTGIQPNSSYDPLFLYYFLLSIRNKILDDSYGGAQKHISQGYVKNILVPFPPLDIQKQIADTLDKASRLIELRKKQIEKMDLLIKSKFIEMFGDPVTNPMGWEKGSIRDIVSSVNYGTSKPATEDGKYIYLRMNNITYDGHLDLSNLKYIDINEKDVQKYIVKKGDILFNRTNSKELVGKTCVFNEDIPMVIAGYIIRVKTNDKANPEYLSAILNSNYGKKTLFEMCKAIVGQANINAQELQNINILIPPIALQIQFSEFVEKIEQRKIIMLKNLDKMELNYKALMQEYFV